MGPRRRSRVGPSREASQGRGEEMAKVKGFQGRMASLGFRILGRVVCIVHLMPPPVFRFAVCERRRCLRRAALALGRSSFERVFNQWDP